jgi:hypothetical protein
MRELLGAVAAVAIVFVTVSGCSGGNAVHAKPATVESAKAAVLAEEKRLVSFIPTEYVEQFSQLDKAHLRVCCTVG